MRMPPTRFRRLWMNGVSEMMGTATLLLSGQGLGKSLLEVLWT